MTYLRLRWEQENEYSFLCHYELVISLDEVDIRRDIYEDGEVVGEREYIVANLNQNGPLRRGTTAIPCINNETGGYYFDTPYRDGAHARWDSAKLGNIPIKVMTIDGTLLERGEDDEAIISA